MSGEFIIYPNDNHSKSMYHIKKFLKDKEELTVRSHSTESLSTLIICERLVKMNYVTMSNIQTSTELFKGRRKINIKITLKKTSDFDKLMEEDEIRRKEYLENRGNDIY